MSLLTIVQKVAPRVGLPKPASVVSSTDLTTVTLFELLNQAGDELARYHDWQNLTVQQNFSMLAQEIQTNALPSDYDRLRWKTEFWNSSLLLRFLRANNRQWQWLKSGGITASVVGYWRILGNQLHILPTPTAGQSLQFEYITKNWCASATGSPQSAFAQDSDVAVIPERLLELSLIWRWQQAKGFASYAESMSTYERQVEMAAAADRGTGMISPERYEDNAPPQPFWTGAVTVS